MTTYAQHTTRVTWLPRETVDWLHLTLRIPPADWQDVHEWRFSGTPAEAEAAATRARDQLAKDETVDPEAWKAVDQVVRILAEYVATGKHNQVQVERPAAGNAKTEMTPEEIAALRLVDLQGHKVRDDAHKKAGHQLDAEKFGLIAKARYAGCSWGEIGRALGMSKQAAQDYYTRRMD